MPPAPKMGLVTSWTMEAARICNCLEPLVVYLAHKAFRPEVQDHHVLIRTENTAVVAYKHFQGESGHVTKFVRWLLFWADHYLLLIQVAHMIRLNCVSKQFR